MKISIMQPYLLPYIGYFQLINATDKFVVYDDVQYIKNGWINRNKFLVNGQEKLYTFSVKRSHLDTNINEISFAENFVHEKRKFIKLIEQNYAKAPNFTLFFPVLQDILKFEEENISKFIVNSLKIICDFLDIKTTFIISSHIEKNNLLSGENRVIHINKCLNSTIYINPFGGVDLYSKSRFASEGIDLYFLKPNIIKYKQYSLDFKPWLSIVDVLMFNSINVIKEYLNDYKLI